MLRMVGFLIALLLASAASAQVGNSFGGPSSWCPNGIPSVNASGWTQLSPATPSSDGNSTTTGVTYIAVTNPGSGYTSTPAVNFSGGSQSVAATAHAVLGTFQDSNNGNVGAPYQGVVAIAIDTPGTYAAWSSSNVGSGAGPTVTISGGGGSGATAVAEGGPAGSMLLHVAASGNDSNSGSLASPFLTLTHALTFARPGMPDWVMLNKGDSWKDQSLGQAPTGHSCLFPAVFTSYGTGARPVVELNNAIGANGFSDSIWGGDYFAVMGIKFYDYTRDPNNVSYNAAHGESGANPYSGIHSFHYFLWENNESAWDGGSTQEDIFGVFPSSGYMIVNRNIFHNSYGLTGFGGGGSFFQQSVAYTWYIDNFYDETGWSSQLTQPNTATISLANPAVITSATLAETFSRTFGNTLVFCTTGALPSGIVGATGCPTDLGLRVVYCNDNTSGTTFNVFVSWYNGICYNARISGITWSAGVATVTVPYSLPIGAGGGAGGIPGPQGILIAGATPSGYNGLHVLSGGGNGTTSFTFALTSDPGGPATVPGSYALTFPNASITCTSGTATVSTGVANVSGYQPGFPNGTTIPISIAGATPSGFNGDFTATVTGTTSFTYSVNCPASSASVPGFASGGFSASTGIVDVSTAGQSQSGTQSARWMNASQTVNLHDYYIDAPIFFPGFGQNGGNGGPVISRGNIHVRCAADGGQNRVGGVIDDNVWVQCPITASGGVLYFRNTYFTNNTVTNPDNIDFSTQTQVRGDGYDQNYGGGIIDNNIIANSGAIGASSTTDGNYGLGVDDGFPGAANNNTVSNNIVCNFNSGYKLNSTGVNNTFAGNNIATLNGSYAAYDCSGLGYANPNPSNGLVPWCYDQVGGGSGSSTLQDFVNAEEAQSKDNWNSNLTANSINNCIRRQAFGKSAVPPHSFP